MPNGANYESTGIIIIHHNNYYYTLDPVDCDCDLPHKCHNNVVLHVQTLFYLCTILVYSIVMRLPYIYMYIDEYPLYCSNC